MINPQKRTIAAMARMIVAMFISNSVVDTAGLLHC
nr:MAG TPA: hypothetical protein [Caudoviricetes sp.]